MNKPIKYKYHPYADLFPMMSNMEFELFRKDIQKNGLSEPILLFEGQILDGRNRYKACIETGVDLKVEQWSNNLGSPLTYVVSRNLHRRHLTSAQRAMIGRKLKPLFEADAKNRQKAGGKIAHGLQSHLSEAEKGQARDLAAKVVSVAPRMISDAERVIKNGVPQLGDSIVTGKISMRKGIEISQMPVEDQLRIIEEICVSRPELITKKARDIGRLRAYERDGKETEKLRKFAKKYPNITDRYSLFCANLKDDIQNIEDGSIDYVITDPPYQKSDLKCYDYLGKFCKDKLKPGGSLLCMIGQIYYAEVLEMLSKHLKWHWTMAYLLEGRQHALVRIKRVQANYKVILWFVKGEYNGKIINDVVRSSTGDRDKAHHKWGQSESGMIDLVRKFSSAGDLICDPFVGGGSTAIAALKCNCRFIGIDIDKASIETTKGRINRMSSREK